jgi:hypothetical protein
VEWIYLTQEVQFADSCECCDEPSVSGATELVLGRCVV